MRRRDFGAAAATLAAAGALPPRWAGAQTRAESLRILSQAGPNSFDPIGVGVNRNAIQLHWNTYDRLLRFGTTTRPDGTLYYDYYRIEGELAERHEVSEDGRVITFHLRRDATFHDGSPVTAEDVKWSLDRVVASPIGRSQFSTGSMTSPDQFTALDRHTFRITLPRTDRFTLPNLAATFGIIVNSRLVRAQAGAADPWGSEWLKTNVAGGGPFRLDAHVPGQSLTLSRFDGWRNGALPGFRRVLWQVVPNGQSRRASLERGDADIVQDLSPQDAVSMAQAGLPSVRVLGVPMAGAFQFIGMNNAIAPFDNVKVRRAIAHALPYRQMFEAALFQRGQPLFGGVPDEAEGTEWPQPHGYDTDPARARALLAEAGLPNGFETTFSFELSLAPVAEPVSLLVQEALGRIGIRVAINKVPPGQLGTLLERKEVPFFFEGSAAYLNDPDYFFRIFYHGPTRWNFGTYNNPEFAALVERTRYETDRAAYERDIRRMIALAKQDIPIILLWQPALDTGMQRSVDGYKYLFHRQLELRTLKRA
ncbi:ABC transporter substrate-binding protein [Falsiroseomonas sp. CW058]|uniref:ABC transporter substrate-binding protein n=1 Tax=Falsiroseomonas sp. CW058 TaxID=3388664 RepID=UPI003D31F3E6